MDKEIKYGLSQIGTNLRLSPFGFNDEEILEFIQEEREEDRYIEQLQEEWINSFPAKQEREYAFDLSDEEKHELRRSYLESRYLDASRKYYEAKKNGEDITKLAKERFWRRIEYEVFTYRPKDDKSFSPEQIAVARSKDIKQFIKSERDFAVCPFHSDKNPSMYLRKNFAYCFGCGWKGDTIALVMKLKDFKFSEAIKFLIY